MSCACENKKYAGEYMRMHRLAKATAKLNNQTVAFYIEDDGTYGFTTDVEIEKQVLEYISPY